MKDKISFVQGEDVNIAVKLKDSDGNPFNLTGVLEITGCFRKDDTTILSLTKTLGAITVVGEPKLGDININITAVNSNLVKIEINQDFEVVVLDSASKTHKAQFLRKLDVFGSICDE